MPRVKLSTQLMLAHNVCDQLKDALCERDKTIELLRSKINYMDRTERRFDQLLDGMCMGMKEGALPRKPY